mgnify:CR=1 FL=1
MAYNSMDLAAFKDVWVFCEQREGKLMPTDFELISEGRKLADELGVKLCGLLLGDNVEGLCKELAGYGADKIVLCESPLLKYYTTDAYAKVICDAIEELKPEVFLIGASTIVSTAYSAPMTAAVTIFLVVLFIATSIERKYAAAVFLTVQPVFFGQDN